jgi:hypothetical protein
MPRAAAMTGRTDCPVVWCPPAQVMVTATSSLVPVTATVIFSIRMRRSFLRSAWVVDGAAQTRGRSPARAWMAERSAAVSVLGCSSVNRW